MPFTAYSPGKVDHLTNQNSSRQYDGLMKYFLLTALMALQVFAAGLGGIKTVYLMPMSNGLDQYLAVRLTTDAVLQVVTDPNKADAVFTDHLGQGFEKSLADLYPSPTNVKPADGASQGSNESAEFARVGGPNSRGRGAAFLVDRKSHDVLWSVYEPSKQTSPKEVKRTADRIVDKLAKTLKEK